MSQYIISALKYRPTDFNEIIGQSSITQTLINAINSNQLPQALLFSGPRGVGKTSCARILARKINNQKKEDDIKFNIFELDAASNNSVDDIRNLNEQVRIPPQLGNYKIYIIDEAHMLSTAAFNAFLKTLEEPPKHAIFILATTEKNKIIPTILSRCQIYDFKTITNIDISLHLKNISKKNNIKFEDEALNIISENADGAMRDALSLYDRLVNLTNGNLTASEVSNNLSILDTDIYIELTKKILNNDIPLILIYLDEILKKGFSHLDFLNGLSNYFRNLMLSKNSNTLKYINSEKSILNKIINQSKNIKIKSIIKCIGIINFSEINYKESKNKRLHVEFCILDIANKLSNSKKKNKILKKFNKEKNGLGFADLKKDINKKTYNSDSAKNLKNPQKEKNLNVSGFSLSSIKFKRDNAKLQLQIKENLKKENLNENFTQNQLNNIWNIYLEKKLEKGDKNIASILKINNPKIENKNTINYCVLNDSNKIELEEEKDQLLPFLKKHLNNNQINLNISVNTKILKKTDYSDNEKYKILLKKNSELDKLRTTFDLEF
tara:strand:- start:8641 stop:10296 length:1656 start_codon:yes stop_codon:yes gene_type:complete